MQEGPFSFGCCLKRDKNGEIKGVRLLMFDYTSKSIKTIAVWNRGMNTEFTRLRNLTYAEARSQGWKGKTKRPKGIIWNDDALTYLNGIGDKTYLKLVEIGLEKISHLRNSSDKDLERYAGLTKLNLLVLK